MIKTTAAIIILVIALVFIFQEPESQTASGIEKNAKIIKDEILPALLPLSNEETCFSVVVKKESVEQQIENLKLKLPEKNILLAENEEDWLNNVVEDEDYWEEKEAEVWGKERPSSSVPLGMQCGGRIAMPFGIGPITFRPCCTGCCVPCIPLVCCSDCGCCVASCERICQCISGPGAAYLWDSITNECGCGIP